MLVHGLADLAMQTDKGLVLAAHAPETQRQQHIILPTLRTQPVSRHIFVRSRVHRKVGRIPGTMKPSHATRFVAAVFAVIGLLFTQLALASYVCPGMSMSEKATSAWAETGATSVDHCTGMDMDQPGLCRAHDDSSAQALDQSALPQVPPFHAIGPGLTVVPPHRVVPVPPAATPSLAHTTAPPLAIRHCCFRI